MTCAHELGQPMPDDEDLLHRRPAQVEVAISEPELLVGLGPVHLERRRGRGVVDDQVLDADLDGTGLEPGVLLAGQAGGDRAFHADHVLVAQLAGAGLELGAGLGLEDDLGDAVAVAQVDEDQAAEVAPGVHPAVQDDGISHVVYRQFTAGMRSFVEHDLAIGKQDDSAYVLRSITIPLPDEKRQAIEDSDTIATPRVRRGHAGRL